VAELAGLEPNTSVAAPSDEAMPSVPLLEAAFPPPASEKPETIE
jgi:hypothetical protein